MHCSWARPLFQQGIRWARDALWWYLMGSAASPNSPRRLKQSNTTLLPKTFSPSACSHKWGDEKENGTPLSQLRALKSTKLNVIFLLSNAAKTAEENPIFSLPTCLLPLQWCPAVLLLRTTSGNWSTGKKLHYFSGVPSHLIHPHRCTNNRRGSKRMEEMAGNRSLWSYMPPTPLQREAVFIILPLNTTI